MQKTFKVPVETIEIKNYLGLPKNVPVATADRSDAALLRLVSKGASDKQIANVFGTSRENICMRRNRLLPKGKIDDVLMELSKGKAMQVLASISDENIEKAGLGERANAAKRLVDINQIVSGKGEGKTLNININIGPGNHLLREIEDVDNFVIEGN